MNEEIITLECLARLVKPNAYMLEIGPGGHPTPWAGPYQSIDLTAPGAFGTAGSEAGVVCTASVQGSMEDLPFFDNGFDVLVARHVLEHHADTLLVLREWFRVLKPGGVLIVICPDQATLAGNTIHLDPTHEAAFTPRQLAALAAHAGFEDIGAGPALPAWSLLLTASKPPEPISWKNVVEDIKSKHGYRF